VPVEQARSLDRHERILESALAVFSERGYRDTAVDDIAVESGTSKGGVYFHFPNKQAIFLALLDRMAALLRSRVEEAIAAESDPIGRADAALLVVLRTFASHRTLSRLFLVEALGADREFKDRLAAIRASFADLIRRHLDDAVRQEAIPPIDTRLAGKVWFGALNELVTAWVLADRPGRLEAAYPALRVMLLRSIGAAVPEDSMTGKRR
jgi:AcrR family transcriptional regulator